MSSSENSDPCSTCELEENLRLLRNVDFFSALPLELLKLLAYVCRRETFSPGDVLFHQGEDDGQAMVFISGRAELVLSDEGREKTLRSIEPGAFIGGLALSASMARLFSLRAAAETVCLVLTRDKFQKAAAQFPDAMPRILKALAGRINEWEAHFLKGCADVCEHRPEVIGVSLV